MEIVMPKKTSRQKVLRRADRSLKQVEVHSQDARIYIEPSMPGYISVFRSGLFPAMGDDGFEKFSSVDQMTIKWEEVRHLADGLLLMLEDQQARIKPFEEGDNSE